MAEKIVSRDLDNKLELLSIRQLVLSRLDLDRKFNIRIESARGSQIALVHHTTPGKSIVTQFSKQFLTAHSAQAVSIHWSPATGLRAKSLVIRDSLAWLYRENHRWTLLGLAKAAIQKLELAFPRFRLDRLELTGKNQVSIVDRSFKPEFHAKLDIKQFRIENIDSKRKDIKSPYRVQAVSDTYTRYSLNGYIQPFGKQKEFYLVANINELQLAKLNPYSENYYGYKLKAGILDAKITTQIKNNILTGNNQLIFTRLDVAHSTANVKDKRFLKVRIPVNLLVKLLADNRNRLKMNFPVKLNLADPDARITLSYLKALNLNAGKAIRLAFTITQPVGRTFTMLRRANIMLVTMRLKPLVFTAGSSHLSKKAISGVARIASLLRKKKRITIQLCPVYTKADTTWLRKQKKVADNREIEKLATTLADERAAAIKSLLVKKHHIPSKRIFLCKAASADKDTDDDGDDDVDNTPRVDVSI